MKKNKKIVALIASLTLTACSIVPFAMNVSAEGGSGSGESGGVSSLTPTEASNKGSITINGISTSQTHTFEVYQIFTGDVSGGENNSPYKLANIKWGSGVSSYDNNGSDVSVTTGDAVNADIISSLAGKTLSVKEFIGKIGLSSTKTTVTSSSGSVTISNLAEGYYLIKDVTSGLNGKDDAISANLVQVAGNVTVNIKSAKPTVDKQVQDEPADKESGADDDGWGETADHAINEQFNFKLTATINKDENLKAYDSYKIVFNDTLSTGVTFDDIVSVTVKYDTDTVNEITLNENDSTNKYTKVSPTTDNNNNLSITINDLKSIVNVNGNDIFGNKDITVEVIYTAHLNENAICHNASADNCGKTGDNATNYNTVSLSYSNNPNNTSSGSGGNDNMGTTTTDNVWVFSYSINNTKYGDSVGENNKIEGAEFELRTKKDDTTTAISMIAKKDGKATYYIPDSTSSDASKTITSFTDGTFNIKGLDAGTYYLVETKAPSGYNLAQPITVTISATHSENSGGDSANVTITDTRDNPSNMSNSVIDTTASALPTTGGIGTTIFYLGGGCMVAVAGVVLISKKRMSKREKLSESECF